MSWSRWCCSASWAARSQRPARRWPDDAGGWSRTAPATGTSSTSSGSSCSPSSTSHGEDMTYTERTRTIGVWLTLVALIGLSWWAGTDAGLGAGAVTAAVLVVAYTKVLLVGHAFMELGRATRLL